MQRAIVRAGIPVWYTEGFNPHIYMTFALPLPLGYESICESMDIRLCQEMPFSEIVSRLSSALPPDIRVKEAAVPVYKAEEIASALYHVELLSGGEETGDWKKQFLSFMESGPITVEKKTKKGIKTIDIRLHCHLAGIDDIPQGLSFSLKTTAGNAGNINPTLLTDAFLKRTGMRDIYTKVVRQAMFTADGFLFR